MLGAIIDNCDVVCRMNQYQIAGYQNDVGSRTDLYISNYLNPKTLNELERDGVKAILVSRPPSQKHAYNVALGKILRNFQQLKKINTVFIHEDDFDELYHMLNIPIDDQTGRNPTTGLTSLYCILKHLQIEKIILIGFNFFDGSHPDGVYYFSRELYNNVTLNELHHIYHPQDAEKQAFRSLISNHPQVVVSEEIAMLLKLKENVILK